MHLQLHVINYHLQLVHLQLPLQIFCTLDHFATMLQLHLQLHATNYHLQLVYLQLPLKIFYTLDHSWNYVRITFATTCN
jgi:hypothetical protein